MYTDKSMYVVAKKAANKGTSIDLASAAVADLSYIVVSQMKIKRLMIALSATISTTNPAVVTFKQYPNAGSSSNAVTLGTISIPTGATIGQVYYKDISGTVLVPGNELVAEVTTAAGVSGTGYMGFEADLDPEVAANQTHMVASA